MKNLDSVPKKSNGTKMIRNIIIIVLILIIVLLGVFAYLYFMTDIFKTNKQLFFEQFAKILDKENGFIETSLSEYENKKQQTPYENTGKFYADVNLEGLGETEDITQALDDFSIEFSGKTDKTKNKAEQNITLHYSDDVEWPLIYRHNEDFYGIQTDTVSEKYVTIENNNLKDLAEKLGIEDVSQIPDKIEISSNTKTIEFTDEEKEQLKEKYMTVLNEKLQDEQFTKESNDAGTAYTLTISYNDFKDLLTELIKTLQTDEITLGKINEFLGEDVLNADSFESILSELEGNIAEEGNVVITLQIEKSGLANISLNYGDDLQMLLNKNSDAGNLKYTFELMFKESDTQSMSIYFNSDYSGMDNLQNVSEGYQLGIEIIDDEQSIGYTYNVENAINFVDSINVEDLSEDNSIILNNYDTSTLQNIIGALGQRIVDVNTDQMEQLGFEYGNPMLYLFPGTALAYNIMQQAQNTVDNTDMSSMEITTFNNQFVQYEGIQRGTMVRALIQEIQANNAGVDTSNLDDTEEDTRVEIEFVGIENLDDETKYGNNAISYINSANEYQVSLEYAENGRVNKVIIEGEFSEGDNS